MLEYNIFLLLFLVVLLIPPNNNLFKLMTSGVNNETKILYDNNNFIRLNKFYNLVLVGLVSNFDIRDSINFAKQFLDKANCKNVEELYIKISLGVSGEKLWKAMSKNQLSDFFDLCYLIENTGNNGVQLLKDFTKEKHDQHIKQIKINTKKSGVKVTLPLGLCFLPAFIVLGALPIIINLTKSINLIF